MLLVSLDVSVALSVAADSAVAYIVSAAVGVSWVPAVIVLSAFSGIMLLLAPYCCLHPVCYILVTGVFRLSLCCCFRPFLLMTSLLLLVFPTYSGSLLLQEPCCCWRPCFCWLPEVVGVYAIPGIPDTFFTVANVPAVAGDHSVVVVPILAVFRTKKSNYLTIGPTIISSGFCAKKHSKVSLVFYSFFP